jgi:hypothetical protein
MSDVEENPRRTVWTCKVADGKVVRLEDIPARQLGDLETRFGVSWLELVGRPLGDSQHALAMYEKCCGLVGTEPADLTVRQLLDSFELVDDDRPEMYVGGLPDPKAGELTTAG